MRFNRIFTVLFLSSLSAFISGCVNKARYLAPGFTYEQAFFPDIRFTEVTVMDERKEIQSGDLSTELTQATKELIRDEVMKHAGGRGQEYKCTVYVTKGEKRQVSAFKKSVRCAVRMELVRDLRTIRPHAETSYELSYPDNSKEFFEKMYQKVLHESIHNCFVSMKEE